MPALAPESLLAKNLFSHYPQTYRLLNTIKDSKNNTLPRRIICLSNVFDEQYEQSRGEPLHRCLSQAKRRDLFKCLELATGLEVIVLSSPPKALKRRLGQWIPASETRFSTHRQLFSCNWDAPKLRIPLSWWHYAWHALRHIRDGDIVVLDNYELIYVLAANLVQLRRKVAFILDYEDGKHLICRGWDKILAGVAEFGGKRLISGALLAHPGLAERLSAGTPTELVPGFVVQRSNSIPPPPSKPVRFLYSGSLDSPRGIDMLLEAVALLPESGWQLDITGSGRFAELVAQTASKSIFRNRIKFHGTIDQQSFDQLASQCHVGLNCQRVCDPISSVTFPSKVFSYLSVGLNVLSTRGSNVPDICGSACLYVDEDTPSSLAMAMERIIKQPELRRADTGEICRRFSLSGTADRLADFFDKIEVHSKSLGNGLMGSGV